MNDNLSVTLVQTSLFWESPEQNKTHLSALLSELNPTDVIVLPELFSTAFSMTAKPESMQGPSMAWMKTLSKEKNALIIGSILIEEKTNIYNRLICMFPDGTSSHYDKRHLFSMMKEDQLFAKGTERLIVEHKGWRICPLVCYDLRFPVFSRNNQDFDLLIYVANWPVTRIKHWSKLLLARAIENQCYVAGVNRIGHDGAQVLFNGQSVVVDFDGENILNCSDAELQATVTLNKRKLTQYRNRLPFLKDQDNFTIQ